MLTKVTVREPSTRYADELFKLRCAGDLLPLGIYPNAKEWTESAAAFRAVQKHIRSALVGDSAVTLVAVGDGHTPRTAAMFACRTAWECYSVDPLLRFGGPHPKIRRLILQQCNIESYELRAPGPVVIVAVHSHANLLSAVHSVRACASLSVVAIPCCKPQDLPKAPDMEYDDYGIWSPMRTVRIWLDVDGL